MDLEVLVLFAGFAAVLTLTPGADTLLTVRHTLRGGWHAGLACTAGVCLGLLVHAAMAGLGLSLILVRSAAAFTVIKWLGAAYLVWLGVQSIRRSMTARDPMALAAGPAPSSRRAGFDGVITNILNPKAAVFYIAVLPQFIDPSGSVLAQSFLLAGIHLGMSLLWLSLISLAVARLARIVASDRLTRWLERIGGAMLAALGVKLALTR